MKHPSVRLPKDGTCVSQPLLQTKQLVPFHLTDNLFFDQISAGSFSLPRWQSKESAQTGHQRTNHNSSNGDYATICPTFTPAQSNISE
jgi:hypothetical protein